MTLRRPHAGLALIALLAIAAPRMAAAKNNAEPAPAAWRELGSAFESARLLSGAARMSALDSIETALNPALRNADDESRLPLRFLAAELRAEHGDWAGAADRFNQAASVAGKSSLVDDATFAAIEASEAAGHDEDAARAWAKWQKENPASPLLPAAKLAAAWNALRRGENADALERFTALGKQTPWITRDARFTLGLALAQHFNGHDTEALALLGERPVDGPAIYARALCLAAQGQRLKAAAAFQQAGERFGATPLADYARLAKANTFLSSGDAKSSAEEFARVAARATDPGVKAEAELRCAGSVFLAGKTDSALALLRVVADHYNGTDVAARAQFLIGEARMAKGEFEPAILEYNRVLSTYFQHKVAASAQYRVARCLDALGRRADATGSYQAVVAGYPLEPEAPAAAYLAGVGLLQQNKPRLAAPYFQIVLDRYARHDAKGMVVFAKPEHQELVEAALCMLEYSWHVTGDVGQVAGAPHLLLQQMPPSHSQWRAYALLIDADATAALGRYSIAESTLVTLAREFPDSPIGASSMQLLAWSQAQQGKDSLAIATEERLLARWGASGDDAIVSAAFIDIAHARFNQKRYKEAAAAYEDFLHRWPAHRDRPLALYQAGLCYLRLDRAGDAVDRWEALVRDSASTPLAERAWARAGDVYFQAEKFADARRCYQGLLDHFAASSAAGLASLRLAQCDYNAGKDAEALTAFAATMQRFPDTPYAQEAKRGQELALYRLTQQPNGSAVLARLVDQYPTSPFAADALLQIAKRDYQAKKWKEAAEGFRQVVSRFPSYSAADQAQFLMADALAQAGATDDARAGYEQFLSYFPESNLAPTVSFRLGLLAFEAKDYMRAAVAFTRTLQDSVPGEVRSAALYDLGLCQRQLGDRDDARAAFAKHRAEFPNGRQSAEAAYQLADLDEADNQLETAEKGFDQALSLNPPPALAIEIAYRLGHCREQLKNDTGAMHAYEEAAAGGERMNPFRLSALARLAAMHETRHEYTKAVQAYRDIIQNSRDKELVAAATDRVNQLSAVLHRP